MDSHSQTESQAVIELLTSLQQSGNEIFQQMQRSYSSASNVNSGEVSSNFDSDPASIAVYKDRLMSQIAQIEKFCKDNMFEGLMPALAVSKEDINSNAHSIIEEFQRNNSALNHLRQNSRLAASILHQYNHRLNNPAPPAPQASPQAPRPGARQTQPAPGGRPSGLGSRPPTPPVAPYSAPNTPPASPASFRSTPTPSGMNSPAAAAFGVSPHHQMAPPSPAFGHPPSANLHLPPMSPFAPSITQTRH
eukprot:TRINITY_DN7974_c0_g1_i1.p1 TRINITY_DN7974_c0_g1~~TRINITY_DN7974_c0_g1_i1.p1  ORF type:complete len:248 (-),score=35.58 TRINITY_DN7974_c0_g1_i1:56-799(-)